MKKPERKKEKVKDKIISKDKGRGRSPVKGERIDEYIGEYKFWMITEGVVIALLISALISVAVISHGKEEIAKQDRLSREQMTTLETVTADIPTEPEVSPTEFAGTGALSGLYDDPTVKSYFQDDIEKEYAWLLENRSLFPESRVEFARGNNGLIDFLYHYVRNEYEIESEISLSEREVYSYGIPMMVQWDKRWGYDPYGDGVIGVTGCGPTCMAMVAAGLLHDPEATPRAVANFSTVNDCYLYGTGTKWVLFSKYSAANGLKCEDLGNNINNIKSALEEGKPVICSVSRGIFTLGGHFIVLTGINEDGTINLNDPNSTDNSLRTWNIDEFSDQISNGWAFSL
ncbi:MAG: C39 family peptidase [Lachnospiraceae bacterium]|nr:C39 family peptidase [Lachnospiraceae bacterium]